MERYDVHKITGRSMDEIESNLKTYLNGLPHDKEFVTVTLGLKEAIVVTKMVEEAPQPAPAPVPPPAPAPAPAPVPVPVQQPAQQAPAQQPAEPIQEVLSVEEFQQHQAQSTPAKTVQFVPIQKQQAQAQPQPAQQTQAPPSGQKPEMLFRRCSHCGNQLILPHIPISVMCPHCKSTVTIND